MRKFVETALAAALVAGLTVTPAAAEEVLVRVDYSDLDLETPAGADALGRRVEAAVKSACVRPSIRDLRAMQAWELCKDKAMSTAMEELSRAGQFALTDTAPFRW